MSESPNCKDYDKAEQAGKQVVDIYDDKHGRYQGKEPAVKSAVPPKPEAPFTLGGK